MKREYLAGGIENMLATIIHGLSSALTGYSIIWRLSLLANTRVWPCFPCCFCPADNFYSGRQKSAKDLATGKIKEKYDAGFIYRTKLIWRGCVGCFLVLICQG
jgi:hypothetical protein